MDFKRLKKFSIIFVPDDTAGEARSIKISLKKLFIFISLYSFFVFLLGFYIISFTPLSEVLFPYSLRLTDSDKKKVEVLNEKVTILAKEIEALKSANKRLKFAIMLGDSTLIDTTEMRNDSIKNKTHYDGNLFAVFKQFLNQLINFTDDYIIFTKPSEGFISKAFDPDRGHFGIDFVVKENSPIFSSAGGYIVFASYTTEFGYTIIINHKDNYVTKYLHCASLLKREGDYVYQGELIALSGNSGTESSGPHLHFEIWKDGKAIDPKGILLNY